MKQSLQNILNSAEEIDNFDFEIKTDDLTLDSFNWDGYKPYYEISGESVSIEMIDGDTPDEFVIFRRSNLVDMLQSADVDSPDIDRDMIKRAVCLALEGTLTLKSRPTGIGAVMPAEIGDVVVSHILRMTDEINADVDQPTTQPVSEVRQ